MSLRIDRRRLTGGLVASAVVPPLQLSRSGTSFAAARPDYRGPNVFVIRFGGGVRRAETIEPATSCSPYLLHELVPRGVFYKDMRISPRRVW